MLSLETREPAPQLPAATPEADATAEFEIVLGKRQIAAVLFLAIVVVVVFSAGSYITGEAMSPRHVSAAAVEPVSPSPSTVTAPTPQPVSAPPQPEPPPSEPPQTAAVKSRPIFGEVKVGELYLQAGSVDKGTATIMVEGLRAHGFDAFAAPGRSEITFRVLIGPFADRDAYHRARAGIDDLGLTVFLRRFDGSPNTSAAPPAPCPGCSPKP
jgi:cell division septation protein DedD